MADGYPFAAVLFDLDGVVVDTTELHYRVWDEFARSRGYSPTEAELLSTNGRPASEMMRAWLGQDLSDQEVAALTAERETWFNRLLSVEPVSAVPGAIEFIAALKRASIPIAVATSAVPANAKTALLRVGLADAFSGIITAADVTRGKPDPEVYLKAAASLGIAPTRCVVIEDSISGIRAARAAGAKCVALSTTFPRQALEREQPEWIVEDFRALPLDLIPR